MFMIDLGAPSHYSLLGIAPDAPVAEIRGRHSKLIGDLERKRLKARNPEEARQIEEQQKSLNRIGDQLSNPTERARYDRDNAHLTFFALQEVGAPVLVDRSACFEWLHGVLRRFVAGRGERVAPLTDLERTDFTSDYTPNALLDVLEERGGEAGRNA